MLSGIGLILPKTREGLRIWERLRREKKMTEHCSKNKSTSTGYGLGPPEPCKKNQSRSVLL